MGLHRAPLPDEGDPDAARGAGAAPAAERAALATLRPRPCAVVLAHSRKHRRRRARGAVLAGRTAVADAAAAAASSLACAPCSGRWVSRHSWVVCPPVGEPGAQQRGAGARTSSRLRRHGVALPAAVRNLHVLREALNRRQVRKTSNERPPGCCLLAAVCGALLGGWQPQPEGGGTAGQARRGATGSRSASVARAVGRAAGRARDTPAPAAGLTTATGRG
mmetsp:Transcript_2431/g.9571  ORF Transcript_2431/g.9571 Transcript_2431/m.9571 type:complete len:220 (+) Transcript_2431:2322-2981(+)